MIIKKIRSLQDTTLKTSIQTVMLTKNQIVSIKFKNKQEFDALINLGVIIEVPSWEVERKEIPVLYNENNLRMEKVVVIPEEDLSKRLEELKLEKKVEVVL